MIADKISSDEAESVCESEESEKTREEQYQSDSEYQ